MSSGNKDYRRLAVFSGLISAIAVTLVGAIYVGHWLDERWGTRPWLTIAGLCVGTAGVAFEVFRVVSRDRS